MHKQIFFRLLIISDRIKNLQILKKSLSASKLKDYTFFEKMWLCLRVEDVKKKVLIDIARTKIFLINEQAIILYSLLSQYRQKSFVKRYFLLTSFSTYIKKRRVLLIERFMTKFSSIIVKTKVVKAELLVINFEKMLKIIIDEIRFLFWL